MNYISARDVVRINEREVGTNLVADLGLLESAVGRPQQTIDVAEGRLRGIDAVAARLHHLAKELPDPVD